MTGWAAGRTTSLIGIRLQCPFQLFWLNYDGVGSRAYYKSYRHTSAVSLPVILIKSYSLELDLVSWNLPFSPFNIISSRYFHRVKCFFHNYCMPNTVVTCTHFAYNMKVIRSCSLSTKQKYQRNSFHFLSFYLVQSIIPIIIRLKPVRIKGLLLFSYSSI